MTNRDQFVTAEDWRNVWRGFRTALLMVTPFWTAVVWWITR